MKTLPLLNQVVLKNGVRLWFLTLALLVTSCASSTAGNSLTFRQLQTNVGWQMEAYRQAGIQVMFTENQKQQVAAANEAYEAAFQKGLQSAGGNLSAPAPPNVVQLANQLLAVLGSL